MKLYPSDFVGLDVGFNGDSPVFESVGVLKGRLATIWYAIRNNHGFIPLGDETRRLVQDLLNAKIARYVSGGSGCQINTAIIDLLKNFDKRSALIVSAGQIQETINELRDVVIPDYFFAKSINSADLATFENMLVDLTRSLVSQIQDATYWFAEYTSRDMQKFVDLLVRIKQVERAISQCERLQEILIQLSPDNLRVLAAGDLFIRDLFALELKGLSFECLKVLYDSGEQLKKSLTRCKMKLEQQNKLNLTVDLLYAYLKAGHVLDAQIAPSLYPDEAYIVSPIKQRAAFDFEQMLEGVESSECEILRAYIQSNRSAVRGLDEFEKDLEVKTDNDDEANITEVNSGNLVDFNSVSSCGLQVRSFFRSLVISKDKHYISALRAYELMGLSGGDHAVSRVYWLDRVIANFKVASQKEREYRDFDIFYIENASPFYSGNFDVHDVLIYRKSMGLPCLA